MTLHIAVFKDACYTTTHNTQQILRVLYYTCGRRFVPFAPDKKQRSGNPARRQSRAGGCKAAHPDCGSVHGSPPLKTSHLHRREKQYRVSERSCKDFTFNIYEAEVTIVISPKIKCLVQLLRTC